MSRAIASALAILCAPAAFAAATGTISGKVSATPEKYLKDTVVYVKEAPGEHTAKTLTMDQKGMEFRPHVMTLTAGDSVKFINSDNVDHNVYTTEGDNPYNLGMIHPHESKVVKFEKQGVYSQLCSVHPEMLAYIFVGQNPYSAAVGKDGSYKLEHVPAGNWQVMVWNPKLKADPASVTVEAGKTAKADFSLAR